MQVSSRPEVPRFAASPLPARDVIAKRPTSIAVPVHVTRRTRARSARWSTRPGLGAEAGSDLKEKKKKERKRIGLPVTRSRSHVGQRMGGREGDHSVDVSFPSPAETVPRCAASPLPARDGIA